MKAKKILKSQMLIVQADYNDLSNLLKKEDLEYKPEYLSQKINRGAFSAEFFVTALEALGMKFVISKQE